MGRTRRSVRGVGIGALLLCFVSVLFGSPVAAAAAARPLASAATAPGAAANGRQANAVAALQAAPGQYYPVRYRAQDEFLLPAKSTLSVKVTGVGGIPATGVRAVAVNFAVGGNAGSGGLIAYPSDGTQPAVTGVPYQSGVYNQGLLVVQPGTDGYIKVANTGAVSAYVFADIYGYVTSQASATPGSTYVPLGTARIVSKVSVPAGGTYTLAPQGLGGIPASGVTAVAFSLIAKGTADGKLTAYPSGSALPTDTVLDYRANEFISNMVFGELGSDGKLKIYNSGTAAVNVYVDVAGYFAAPGRRQRGRPPSRSRRYGPCRPRASPPTDR